MLGDNGKDLQGLPDICPNRRINIMVYNNVSVYFTVSNCHETSRNLL